MEEKKREQLRKVPTRKLLASIKKDLKRSIRPVAAASRKPKKG
jgi:hypothetical protein